MFNHHDDWVKKTKSTANTKCAFAELENYSRATEAVGQACNVLLGSCCFGLLHPLVSDGEPTLYALQSPTCSRHAPFCSAVLVAYLRELSQVEHKIQSAEFGEGFHLELQKAGPSTFEAPSLTAAARTGL